MALVLIQVIHILTFHHPQYLIQRWSRYLIHYEDVKTIRPQSISHDIDTSGSHHSFHRSTTISQLKSYSWSHSKSLSIGTNTFISESHHSLYRTSSLSQITTTHNGNIRFSNGMFRMLSCHNHLQVKLLIWITLFQRYLT